jgi:Helicase conserved C-terminal domain
MPPIDSDADWTARCRDAMSSYSAPLFKEVASRLIRPRANQPNEELLDKSVGMLVNPPVIDRRIRDLPVASQRLIALIGLSRQPRWRVGHILMLLSSLGHDEGFGPIEEALKSGLIYPYSWTHGSPLDDFTSWLGRSGSLSAEVFAHPAVAMRARGVDLGLPELGKPELAPQSGPLHSADGLDWPLRLAAMWQQVLAAPVRHTQANTLFKKDLTRLQSDELLSGSWSSETNKPPDLGVLALQWAAAAELLSDKDSELTAAPFPPWWEAEIWSVLAELLAALPRVESWDPLAGYSPSESGLSPVPTAGLLTLLLLARAEPTSWVDPQAIAEWLWTHHPTWAGCIPKDHAPTRGALWLTSWLAGIAYPLGLVDSAVQGDLPVRLSSLGRNLIGGAPPSPAAPAYQQTLLVQPNAEIVAYRQGLTPSLIATLSRFARWTGLGPACTLELSADHIYRGLESGLTLPMIMQALARHSSRPIPPAVADLLHRWASKRERITVFSSAVLVEFATPAELDAAVNRGIISLRLNDRVGMTADGSEPGLNQLRLIANRDYEARPQQCIQIGDDGVTLSIDGAAADLLLDAEIARFSLPLPSEPMAPRRYRLTGELLRRAAESLPMSDIDAWFADRTGRPLSAAGQLFLSGPEAPPPIVARLLVVRFPSPEMADGAMQWPETRQYISERLGPTIVAVSEDSLASFQSALSQVGIAVQ